MSAADNCPSCRLDLWSPGHVHYTDAEHREHIADHRERPAEGCTLCRSAAAS